MTDNRLELDNRALVVAVVLLAMGLAITAWLTERNNSALAQTSQDMFAHEVDELATSLETRLSAPIAMLQVMDGLHASHGRPTSKSLQAFVQAQDLSQSAYNVKGLGWIDRVAPSTLQQYVAGERIEQGNDFQVVPQSANGPLYVVKAIEPRAANASLWAQDASGQTSLREAIDRAVGQGETVLARSIAPADSPWGTDFFYFKPEYKVNAPQRTTQEREAALEGLWVARLVTDRLLATKLTAGHDVLDFELLDMQAGGASALVISSASSNAASRWKARDFTRRTLQTERPLMVGGHRFTLRAGSNDVFDAKLRDSSSTLIGVTGGALSAMTALTAWLLLRARNRAQWQARTTARDLAKLTHIIQGTSHLVFMSNADHDLVWANDAYTRLTGIGVAQATGRRIDEMLEVDAASATAAELLREALDQHHSLRTQLLLRNRDGGVRWFDLDLQVELDAQNRYVGYTVIATDFTALQQANEQASAALRENEALMTALDQHSIVSVTDHRGNITYVNDMFCMISGYTRAELLGSNHRIVKSDVQDDAFWESMWKTISSGYTWRATVCNRAKDGSLYWVDSVIAPFFDDAGNIEKYVSIRSNVTPARKAQEELATEREHLNAILVGTDAGTWEWDVPSGHMVVNSRWAEILGYNLNELGEVTVETWAELCHPDDLLLAKELLMQHFRGTLKSYSCEFRMQHKEGHWIWIYASGKVSSWVAPGQPHWVSGIHLDITVQKHLQAEVSRNNAVMQSILENIPVALSVFDSNLQLIARNDKFLELLEFPSWLFEGESTSFESLIRYNAARGEYGSGDVEQAVQYIIERARNTTPHQFERVRPNGQALEVRGAPMPGGGFITTYADISERKKTEAEIQRSNNLLQSVLDATSEVAIISIDLETRITLFNKGAERIFGYQAENVVGQTLSLALFDAEEMQKHSEALSAQAGYPITGLGVLTDISVLGKRTEWTTRHRDGHTFTSSMVVTPMTDNQGRRSGYLCVSFDITQEKKNELALHLAVELAQQAAMSKGQFLANMSHEIRTPMNAVLGMLTLLQNTNLDTQQLDYTVKAESAARSLLGLLNDILDYSKAEAGKMQLDPHPFSVSQLLRDLQVVLSGNLLSRDIRLVFDIDPSVPDVLVGDALRLQQILINLGGNAIKFTERGEVLVSIRQRMRDDNATQLRFLVKDSGIGIDPANQQHIFSGFSQAEASTTRRFGGSGLGLSICKRLVELMGGELKLESALGQGSTFYFDATLPIASEAQAAGLPRPLLPQVTAPPHPGEHRVHSPEIRTRKDKPQRLKGMRLLVVEDNPINQQVAKELLGAEGAMIMLAGNGQLGVEAVAAANPPFDAVLMDMQMPVMDGYTAARTIRGELGLKDLPIIAVTANAMASDREACMAAGMNDHIGKPFDLPRLITMLLRYTGREAETTAPNEMVVATPSPPVQTPIDTPAEDEAIARLGGNTELYLQILQTFLQDIAAFPAQLRTLLDRNDTAAAVRLLHTNKGLSLTVGARQLSDVCKEGESTLKAGPEAPGLADRVEQAVAHTISRLQNAQVRLTSALPQKAQLEPTQHDAVLNGLQSLRALLATSNLQALDVFSKIQPATAVLGTPDWQALQSAMMALNFEKALAHCDNLIHRPPEP